MRDKAFTVIAPWGIPIEEANQLKAERDALAAELAEVKASRERLRQVAVKANEWHLETGGSLGAVYKALLMAKAQGDLAVPDAKGESK